MSLQDMILADATSVFCNTDDFASVATYVKRNRGSREIDVVIERDQPSFLDEASDVIAPMAKVYVANTRERGIAGEELNLGGDSIRFAARASERETERTIVRLLEQDEGMLVLECR